MLGLYIMGRDAQVMYTYYFAFFMSSPHPQLLNYERDSEKVDVNEFASHDTKSASEIEVAVASEPPEGGTTAWMTLVGGWLTIFCSFGYANAFGVFQDLYTRSGAASALNVSWIGSVQWFFLIAAGLPAGRLLDAGHFRLTMAGASILFIFCNFMLSLADTSSYYQLLLSQGFGIGIASGLMYMPALAIQGHYWNKNRAAVMALVSTSAALGGICIPIMLNQLINGSVGFAWGVRTAGFLCLVLLGIANLLMRPKPRDKNADSRPPPKIADMLKDWPFMMFSIGCMFVEAGALFPVFYIQLFSVLKGLDKTFAFYLISILNGSSMFGRLIMGVAATRLGVINIILLCGALCGALVLVMFGVKDSAGAVILCITYGWFYGAVMALFPPAVASFIRDPSEIGVRMGIGFMVASFGVLAGTPVDGALLPGPIFDYPWHRPIIFSSIMCIAGAIIGFVARCGQVARVGKQKI